MVMGIRSRVLEGHSLASSLGRVSERVFEPVSVDGDGRRTIRPPRLGARKSRDYTERRYESTRNVEMALFYPVILFLLAVAIVGALLVYVVPDIVHVFENTGQELPWLTAALIGLSDIRARIRLADRAADCGGGLRRALARRSNRTSVSSGIGASSTCRSCGASRAPSNSSRYASTLTILTRIRRAARRGDDDRRRGRRQPVAEKTPDRSNPARQRRREPAHCARSPQGTFRR